MPHTCRRCKDPRLLFACRGGKEWPSQRLEKLAIEIRESDGANKAIISLTCRIDTLDELEYFRNGGILQYVLRQLAA